MGNPVPNVWSVHVRMDSYVLYQWKGASKDAALCFALGEYLERISTTTFTMTTSGEEISKSEFVHYPDENGLSENGEIPKGILDDHTLVYNPDSELKAKHLIDTNSGNIERGI